MLGTFFYSAALGVFISTLMSLCESLSWFFALFSHFHPQMFVVSLILAFIYFLKGRKSFTALLCLCTLTHGWILVSSLELKPFSSSDIQIKESAPIRVLALNMHGDERTLEPTAKIIEEEEPTLILLTELPESYKPFIQSLKELYPYVIAQNPVGRFDVFLLSRWPIKNWSVERSSSFIPLLHAEVCIPRQTARCFSLAGLHAPVPFFSSGNTLQKQIFNHLIRVGQNKKQDPFIIIGDLNSTPWSSAFRSLLAQSEVRSSAIGLNWQTTWLSRNPLLGLHIDHILINKHVESRKWWVGRNVGSDHYPVLADLDLLWP